FDEGVDLGDAPGAANVGEKAMTLVHSALAGGTWIGDADWLRAGATEEVLGHRVAASSTLGTFLRSFTWGTARQLDQVAGEALTRAWAAGAGPGPLAAPHRHRLRPLPDLRARQAGRGGDRPGRHPRLPPACGQRGRHR
ncbi:MAG TPA: hypothetical protein VG035_05490, partial [Actinomycetota bacterium]|nr:hypothetical protein [Actinomycetota bacterium]